MTKILYSELFRAFKEQFFVTNNLFLITGQVYDLKTVSQDMIKKRVQRTGDGTHKFSKENSKKQPEHDHHEQALWGWDDKDITDFHKAATEIYNVAKPFQD